MSSGIGILGREVTATVGGLTLLGTTSKGISFNNEPLDTTNDSSQGWQERLALPGVKSVEFTMSGLLQNLELVNAYITDNGGEDSQLFAIVINYPDGSVLSFDGFMDSLNTTGESNALFTFDATFSSSGQVTFVAGT